MRGRVPRARAHGGGRRWVAASRGWRGLLPGDARLEAAVAAPEDGDVLDAVFRPLAGAEQRRVLREDRPLDQLRVIRHGVAEQIRLHLLFAASAGHPLRPDEEAVQLAIRPHQQRRVDCAPYRVPW